MAIEICENCGSEIGKLEKAFVHEQHIVCALCYKKIKTTVQEDARSKKNVIPSDIQTYDNPEFLPLEAIRQDEKIIYEDQQNLTCTLFWPVIASILIVIYGFLMIISDSNQNIPDSYNNIFGLLIILSAPIELLIAYLRWKYIFHVITSKRVIKYSGVIIKNIFEAPLEKVQDLTMKRGILQRILNCGNIVITTAGRATAESKWKNVDEPYEIQNILSKIIGGSSGF